MAGELAETIQNCSEALIKYTQFKALALKVFIFIGCYVHSSYCMYANFICHSPNMRTKRLNLQKVHTQTHVHIYITCNLRTMATICHKQHAR